MTFNLKSVLSLIVLILIFVFFFIHKTAASPYSLEFIVDFSNSMNAMNKAAMAREVVTKILDEIPDDIPVGLTLSGHRYKDKCDDIELLQDVNRKKIKDILIKTKPKGRALIALALKKIANKLKDNKNYMIIILLTDGEETCNEGLLKVARQLKERYDYRLIIHVIGINPKRTKRIQLRHAAYAGYGEFWSVRDEKDAENASRAMSEKIINFKPHNPKVIALDEMVLIPEGEFLMGSNSGEGDSDEYPQHTVYLDAFYIDRYEVTQQQFRLVMGYNPSLWIGSDLPVDSMSWFEAKEFCEKVGKRLPTEAEWEKAAKGGRDDKWAGTSILEKLGEYAWLDDINIGSRSGSRTHPVGEKKPNGYGIYDMSGNVWEWVADWYDGEYYKKSPRKNPTGPDKGVLRILRGGCWDNHWYGARITNRYPKLPELKYANYGFRCAKSVTHTSAASVTREKK